jgi:F0F1-type ATP synthase membrane subunit a
MNRHSTSSCCNIRNGKRGYRNDKIIRRHNTFERRSIGKERGLKTVRRSWSVMCTTLFVALLTAFLFQPLERAADSSGLWLTFVYSDNSRWSALVSLLAVITTSIYKHGFRNYLKGMCWAHKCEFILPLSIQMFIPCFGFQPAILLC